MIIALEECWYSLTDMGAIKFVKVFSALVLDTLLPQHSKRLHKCRNLSFSANKSNSSIVCLRTRHQTSTKQQQKHNGAD